MLPALRTDRGSLADVTPSILAALTGGPNPLGLPPVRSLVLVLVDGLGAHQLKARAGHARFLAPKLAGSVMESGFPTTTAAALGTLLTGERPGQHGLVGYTALDTHNDRVLNMLSGWDDRLDPLVWQRMPTLFQRAADTGVRPIVVGPERYRGSGFTRAVLRGAEYFGGTTVDVRVDRVLEQLAERPTLAYLYVPELDMAGHARGWSGPEWEEALEEVDGALARLAAGLGRRDGAIVTADHGMVDIPESGHVLFGGDLVEGVRFIAGDPRCLQLHLEPDARTDSAELLAAAWREAEGDRAWVATRDEAIAAGWFGPVDREVAPRIGDVLVAARARVAYYDERVPGDSGLSMVGQHGSFSPEELRVPFLRLGAVAR